MTVKLLWRSDVHLSDRAPASRTDDWAETVFHKLNQVRAVARRTGVAAVLDGGDYFHTKSPSRNSHRLVRATAEHHAEYPCPVFCTPGNHDSIHGDYSYLHQQPLGVLYAAGVFQRLYDEWEVYFGPTAGPESAVGVFPYNRREDKWSWADPFQVEHASGDIPIVRVVGIPYHGRSYDVGRLNALRKGDEDHLVCVAHLLASKAGGMMFESEDVLRYDDLVQYAPDVWLFGHWHKDQGVTTTGDKKFVNLGALTRGSLVQDEVERRPAIAMITFSKDEISVQTARLKVAPAEDVFDMGARVRAEAREMTMDAFVSSVKDALVDTQADSLEDTVNGLDVPDLVRERAIEYLERVG